MADIGFVRVADCPICLGTFKDPRVLPCGHSFCLGCIREHGRSKDSDPDCPNCRKKFQITSDGFEALPKNYSLSSVFYESAKTAAAAKVRVATRSCKKHNFEELAHYCVQCSMVICVDCRDEDHQKHDCYKISRFAKDARTQLECYKKSIQPILSQVESQKFEVEEESRKFCDLLGVTELAINEECEQNKRLLDSHKCSLLEELSNEKQRVTKDLKMRIDDIETERLRLASFVTRIEDMLQGTDEATILDMVHQYKDFKDSFDKLVQIQPPAMAQVSSEGIKFIPGDLKDLIRKKGNAVGRLQKESDSRHRAERSRALRKDLTPSNKQVDLSVSQRVPIDPHVWYYLERKHPNEVDGIAKKHMCISRIVNESSNEGITHCLEVAPYALDDADEARKHVDDAIEEFAMLHQKVSLPKIDKERIKLPSGFGQSEFERLVAQLEEMGIFFLRIDGPCLVGPSSSMEEAKQKVLDFSSVLNDGPAHEMQPDGKFSLTQASAADSDDPLDFKTTNGLKVYVSKGDLVHQTVDAIVNPANEDLRHGGGAAGAIAKAAGLSLQWESSEFIQKHGRLQIGSVMHTTAGNLKPKIRFVIHTVGPRKSNGKDDGELLQLVKFAICNSLCYANDILKIYSVAIPAISSGIFGVPIEIVGRASFEALEMFDNHYGTCKKKYLREVHFINNDDTTYSNMKRIFRLLKRNDHERGVDPQKLFNIDKVKNDTQVNASDVAGKKGTDDKKEDDDNHCIICMDDITDKKELPCKHKFCRECIDNYFAKCQPKCPSCGKVFGTLRGDQPKGTMSFKESSWQHLPGYNGCGTIEIEYYFGDGIQGEDHPNPGQQYRGTHRTAYLPANKEGREVLRLLRSAFDAGLVFTIGRNNTTGRDNVVIWNDIHHKTSPSGQYGYPDPTYLKRVKDELAAKGIQ